MKKFVLLIMLFMLIACSNANDKIAYQNEIASSESYQTLHNIIFSKEYRFSIKDNKKFKLKLYQYKNAKLIKNDTLLMIVKSSSLKISISKYDQDYYLSYIDNDNKVNYKKYNLNNNNLDYSKMFTNIESINLNKDGDYPLFSYYLDENNNIKNNTISELKNSNEALVLVLELSGCEC